MQTLDETDDLIFIGFRACPEPLFYGWVFVKLSGDFKQILDDSDTCPEKMIKVNFSMECSVRKLRGDGDLCRFRRLNEKTVPVCGKFFRSVGYGQ